MLPTIVSGVLASMAIWDVEARGAGHVRSITSLREDLETTRVVHWSSPFSCCSLEYAVLVQIFLSDAPFRGVGHRFPGTCLHGLLNLGALFRWHFG